MERGTFPSHPTTRERRERQRRIWRTGFALSVLIHVLVFVLWPSGGTEVSPYASAGPRQGGFQAAEGAMEAVQVAAAPARPSTPPPVPTPELDAEPPRIDDESRVDPSEVLGERPGTDPSEREGEVGEPAGRENAEGVGDGGTAEKGLYRMVPPSPRAMIVPPSSGDVEGEEIEVWVFVDETGRVVPDSTRLESPTGNDDFDRRLMREAAEWIFEPARRGGEAIAAWFPYQISM